jgi:hypothetical protein
MNIGTLFKSPDCTFITLLWSNHALIIHHFEASTTHCNVLLPACGGPVGIVWLKVPHNTRNARALCCFGRKIHPMPGSTQWLRGAIRFMVRL